MQLVVPSDARTVERRLESARRSAPTFVADGALPDGFSVEDYRATVGYGIVGFRTAREGLSTWAAHRIPGLRVFPADAPVEDGGTYLLAFGTPLLAIGAPCRVTAVVDEPWHYGFTYATLPGHPEVGQESFDLTLDHDDVVFEVSATSRPTNALVASPPGRYALRATSRRYLAALTQYVRLASPLP